MANGIAEMASIFTSLHVQATILAVAVVVMLLLWRRRADPLRRYLMAKPPKDTVVLHQYGKGYTVPSISPFVMKLETYLKVTNIPYINKYSRQPGPKGKLPWIQYNDQVVADSQFCIKFLNRELNIQLHKHLTPDQLAIGHLVRRTAEESLYWAMITWRLLLEKTGIVYKKLGLPSAIIWYLRRAARSGLQSQGIGRHSEQEVMQLMEEDLQALSQILGEKRFLFGDKVSEVTEFDCALFGQLSQIVWQMPGTPVENTVTEKHQNLVRFCERMKSSFWPEWDDRILCRKDKYLDEDLSTTTNEQAESHQMTSANNVPTVSMGKNSASTKFTPVLPRRTLARKGDVVTGSSPLLGQSDGTKTIANTHPCDRSAARVSNNGTDQSDNKTTITRRNPVSACSNILSNQIDIKMTTNQSNQLSSSSILARKPSLCLQQQYYHDVMTF